MVHGAPFAHPPRVVFVKCKCIIGVKKATLRLLVKKVSIKRENVVLWVKRAGRRAVIFESSVFYPLVTDGYFGLLPHRQ